MATNPDDLRQLKDQSRYDFTTEVAYAHTVRPGLGEDIVREISAVKHEPPWMLEFRLKALEVFLRMPVPTWSVDLSALNFDDFTYYMRPTDKKASSWEEVPAEIKETFDRLGIQEAEQKFLAGVETQFDSEAVYGALKREWEEQGIIFVDMDTAVRDYPDLVRAHIGTVVPVGDNKFAALNSAFWSGGSFVYVPPGVEVAIPLQAYFRINAQGLGQFERTIIIANEGSKVHYIEGCTAPSYSKQSLHTGVIEILVKRGASARYTTIQNWSRNVYNLVTQRARVEAEGSMYWVDANLGCLAEGSTVTTPNGLKRIEEVEVGEAVLSLDEATGALCFRRVTAKRFSGYQAVCEISHGERRLRVTANHPFYSYHYRPERARKLGRYELGYVCADSLNYAIIPCTSVEYGQPYTLTKPDTKTHFLAANQYGNDFQATRVRESRLNLPERTTVDIMWLYGLFLGDGDIVRRPSRSGGTRYAKVGFSVPRDDRARDRLMAIMSELLDVNPTERKDGVYLAWNSVELADFFEQNGFTGNARTKRLPEWVYSLPEQQRLALLAGYLDADGTVCKNRFFSIKSVNLELLRDIGRLATTLGITTRIYTEYTEERPVKIMEVSTIGHGSYQIAFRIDQRLLPHLSAGIKTKIKEPISAGKHRIGCSTIKLAATLDVVKVQMRILSDELVPTWDIEVEGTGNFVSEGFIVHNSFMTMKYPAVVLSGPHAHGEIMSIAFAGDGQHYDAGAKAIHLAPATTSSITSKSISKGNGRSGFRGLVRINPGATGAQAKVACDALLLDPHSRSDTYPYLEVHEDDAQVEHEATVSKISEEQLFYLMSRGLSEAEASSLIINGFLAPFVKELPMEYAVELNRLIQLQMEGSVG